MQRHPDITRKRIQHFLSDEQLPSRIYPKRASVCLSVYAAPGRISFDRAMCGRYRPARVGGRGPE